MKKNDEQRYQEAFQSVLDDHENVIGNIRFKSYRNDLVDKVDKFFSSSRIAPMEACFELGIMVGKKMERAKKRNGTTNS